MYFEIYQDESEKWKWRFKATGDGDDETIAISHEGHHYKETCYYEIRQVKATTFNTPVYEV